MTIQAQLADGRVLEFPDGTDPSVIQATVKRVVSNPLAGQSTEALESAKSAPISFGDVAKSLSSGVIGGGKSLVDFFGAGTGISKGLGEAQSYLQESLSPERKEEIARRQELQERAAKSGSLFQEAKAYIGGVTEAPIQSLAQAAGSSAPAIITSIAALPASAPAALALGVGTIAKLTVGAIQGVGEYKGSVFDAVKAEYMKQGKSEQEAEALALKSQEYSRDKAFEIGGSALLGALDAATGAEPSVAKAMRKASPTGTLTKEAIEKGVAALPEKAVKAPSYLGQLGRGVATEAPLEGAQGAFGQYGENVALQQAGADVTPMQGVLGAGLRDATVGALFGGAASPLGMRSARQDYATDQMLRQAKEDIELDKRAEESEKTKQQAKEGLGATGKQLLLPAPGKTYEEPKDLLQDPVGRITEDELGKAIGDNTVVNYLNKYRRDNKLPKLKSYSVEDIKDAMTAQNPEGEEGALNSILAYKTGYKDETYTPEDINSVAVAKNVATETKGFSDFLTRATGKSDLNTMTQPQLHSVAKALEALPRTGKEEQLVLPEGSNATRFTQDQYNQGVTTALMGVKQGKPVSLDQARNAVKAQTDLKTDRDADQVLKTAASNEDLIIERGTGFQATNKTGEVLGIYGTEAEAKRSHRRADITPVETQLVRAPEEIKTEKIAKLPEGYGIEKTAEVGEERPAAYVLREEGSTKNASQTFAEEVDVKRHQDLLVRKREANATAKDAEADRIRKQLEAQEASIAQMEADGLTGTAEHTKAVNTFKAANVSKSDQITKLVEEAQVLRTPLKIVPLGKKTTKVEKHTVIKGGKKLGTFENKTKAEEYVLSQADEKELQSIADRGGVMGKRAETELGERKRTAPGIKVKGTAEGLEKAGVRTPETEAKLKELEAKLKPMLDKFGLGDVALKVVRAINNDAEGSFKGTDKLIQVAFNATNPIKTMRHEALHALKELGFFTPQQWKALEKQAKDKWIGQYLENVKFDANTSRLQAYRNLGLTEDDIIEEAIADAFGDYEAAGKAPPGMLAALFKRLQQFFKALRQALTGAGFESAEEIFGKIEAGKLKAGKQAEVEGEKFALKTVQDVIDDGIRRLVESARKYNVRDLQDRMGVGLARADTSFTKIEDGIEKRLAALGVSTNPQDDNNTFGVVFNKVRPAVNEQLRKDAEERNKRSLNAPSQDNAWQADEQTIEAADEFEEDNGIRPYVSEGFLDLPTDGTKYSLQKYNPEKHLSFDASLGVPINKDGLITLYYHTTKEKAVQIGNKKIIPSEGRNRVYLTNESNGADVLRNRGNFDQEFDGSTVLVYVHPDMLQVDDVQDNGRRDFFIPLAQGDFFNKKMKLQSIQKSRTSPITEVFSYNEHEKKIADAVKAYKDATPAERRKLVSSARKVLKQEHNVGSLLSENGKLEKTRVGEYDLDWDGNSVASMGLGLASAQQISEKVSTCPRSAICEGLCLGETSGGNFMFGGAASEDVGDIQKSSFRAAARMMQYLKTEALITHPEEFATVLQAEIDSLAKWSASETQNKRNKETGKNEKIQKEIYQPAIRLNVTSDFKPTMFRAIIEANPDTMFYDYTKLGSDSIAPNHHLTYSSTGFGQVVSGEKVFFKDKSGKYDHNWATMRSRLNDGQNVAMAFSSKSGIPSFLVDEETGIQYRVWNGDDYDARFLDPKQPDGKGMIIGLKNKAGNLSEKNATEKTGGFFVQYDPKTDGDTVVVPNQAQFKTTNKTIEIKPAEKLSLKTFFPTAEEAENAAYQKAPPGTAEFKRFFGGSTIKEEGRAVPMFHASPSEFDVFRENKPIFISPSASEAEFFGRFHYAGSKREKGKVNVYPLWVRAETPFDFENEQQVDLVYGDLFAQLGEFAGTRDRMESGDWSYIEDPAVLSTIKKLGFDSFYVKEGGIKNLAVFNANQVKSITGNIGDFSENKSIKFSLKPVSADIDAAIDRTTTAREEQGFIGRILEAIFPKSAGHFRQQALNRYNQLGVNDKKLAETMGGAALLADQSAESAALMSDLSASVTASAFGYGNRTGGVPVYKNGLTTIDTSVKGPIAILAPLAKYNNPRIYQRYQYWAGVKRGKRFMADGKEKNFEQADIARAAQLEKDHPEFVQIQKEMNEFNNGLVKYMVQTGVLDPARAKVYMEHADYIPFYRQMDGERTIGPNIFQSISGVKPPKALKGSEAPLADYLETIVRNAQSAIQSGMKNVAAQRAVDVAVKIKMAQRLNTQDSGPDTVQVLEKGVRVSYRTADPLFIDACRSLNLPDLPFMGILSAPADILRNLVTKDPGFMLANMMRDSLSSWVTSGTNMTPIIGTMSGFVKALSGKSASMEALLNAGVLGGYEFSSGVLKSGEVLAEDMNKKYGKATGAKVLLKPFTSLWDALEKGTEASDAATRIAIYERVLAETGNEAEAIFRSLEVMNFNRKGSSAIIRIATAAIPFLNARMQGLDIFYRTAFGRDTVADPVAKQKAFFVRGATLMALSVAAYIMVSDDDEYKKQEEETKDNYWIIPGVGKFPVPFEVGFLFKTVPERIYAAMFKDDTGEDLKESMKRGIISTLAFNPVPQTFKPIAEALVNYNSFTGRVIVGAGMEGRSPEFQVGPGTSEVAKQLGSALGLSPLKVDHVLQGYTGTIGMYLVQVTDSVLSANDNSPNASKRFEQLPIIKRFAVDPEARGNITQFYALKNATDQAVTTLNFLERSGDAEAYAKYFEENIGILANKNYVNSIEKQMKGYREMRAMIQSAEMSADEKRDILIDIGRAENALNENIKEVKKAIKELQ
jgi:hypothetical protein